MLLLLVAGVGMGAGQSVTVPGPPPVVPVVEGPSKRLVAAVAVGGAVVGAGVVELIGRVLA